MRIGIDLGGTNVRMGIVDNGVVIKKIAEPCKADKPEDEIIEHLKSMIRQLMSNSVESIGIGVPSVVDAERGIVYNVTNIPSWQEVHLKEIMEKEFNIPVYVNNDCNCFAIGESTCGEGRGYKDLVCVAMGTGVGAGIIIDNKLYNGVNTGAGEIGCLPYLDYDYESYCASVFFTREYGITGKEAFMRAEAGDPEALKIWSEVGHHTGNLMKAILFTYDPSAVVLGGSVAKAYKYFEPSMMKTLNTFPFTETVKNFKIHLSQNEDISILGAAMLN